MEQAPIGPRWERLLAPRALLAGVVVGLLACCGAGYVARRHNHIHHFERFHILRSPESLYYPTACQVRELARSRIERDKIAVIIGGSSILHGTCQPVDEVWTAQLQDLLGDEYRVLNLGVRLGHTGEFGAVAAEVLSRDYPKLILVSDLHPTYMCRFPDGVMYKYFFWDAYCKGLLLPHPERDACLAQQLADAEQIEQTHGRVMAQNHCGLPADRQRELRVAMGLDDALSFHDLWNTTAYTRWHSVWTPRSRASFTLARRHWADPDPEMPTDAAWSKAHHDQIMTMVRSQAGAGCRRDAAGRWVEDPTSLVWQNLERAAVVSFPEPTRPRTLLLVLWYNPGLVGELSAEDQAGFAESSRRTVDHLHRLGFSALEVGPNYLPADFGDGLHLAPPGAAKLAGEVAPRVRELARRLGYVKGEDSR